MPCKSSNTLSLSSNGMIMQIPHNKHELSTESSFLQGWNGLNRSWILFGHPFCTYCITLEIIGSFNKYFDASFQVNSSCNNSVICI